MDAVFFVFGIVLIARISIEQGAGRAMIYGIALALVVWLALQAFISYPAGSPLSAFRGVINFGLIAVAWWCAHRLTWDCTYLNDRVDDTGQGVLQAAGLDERQEERQPGESATAADGAPTDRAEQPPQRGLLGWWDRYCRYRAEQLRKAHTPGVWVVYFSLAALPLFGLGQSLIPPGDSARRRYAFWLMVCYVASGLALLLSTSFLGLRRYLRQRKLKMPAAMTGMWIALGGTLIVLMMLVGALLPRPYAEYQLIGAPLPGSKERNASRYAVLREGAARGEGRPSSDKLSRKPDGEPSSGKGPDARPGEAAEGKSPEGKAASGENGSATAAKQRRADNEGNSARPDAFQDRSRSANKAGERRQGARRSQAGSRNDSASRSPRDEQQKRPSGGPRAGRAEEGRESTTGPSSDSTTSVPLKPVFEVLPRLGWLGTVLKWLVFGILALTVLFFLLRSGLNFLANFTNWARRFLEALRAWWDGWFSRAESQAEGEMEERGSLPPARPFASFSDPFLDGRAHRLAAEALVRYSFEALQAWAWEHGLGRQPDETVLEFAERLCTLLPEGEAEVRGLAGLYVRLAYARGSLQPGCLGLLQRFWQRLATLAEPSSPWEPVPAHEPL